jgi:hypothetical protein
VFQHKSDWAKLKSRSSSKIWVFSHRQEDELDVGGLFFDSPGRI